jgi:hypothetical protein
MAESLRQKQSRFARMTAQLINHATILGYEITFAHAYRSQDEAKRLGFSKSLHCQRLAIDLNLFKNGRYLTSTKAHTPLGEYWESIGGSWGGRFNDGNHYSLEHRGIK